MMSDEVIYRKVHVRIKTSVRGLKLSMHDGNKLDSDELKLEQ